LFIAEPVKAEKCG